MVVDTWGFEIISSKDYYLVSKCVKNGRQSKVERCRQVTITRFNMQRERELGGGGGRAWRAGVKGARRRGREKEEGERRGVSCRQPLPRCSPNNRELEHLRRRVQRILLPAMICTRNL